MNYYHYSQLLAPTLTGELEWVPFTSNPNGGGIDSLKASGTDWFVAILMAGIVLLKKAVLVELLFLLTTSQKEYLTKLW